MRIIDINVNEQGKALYRKTSPSGVGGNEWRELGEKGKEQVLTEAQILELSELIVKIENHYGFPCDIEWAFEGGKFYIVQSRPITTLQQTTNDGVVGKRKRVIEELGIKAEESGILILRDGNFFVKNSELDNIKKANLSED